MWKVFPTPVGVFPYHAISDTRKNRLPHARGGVSQTLTHGINHFPSSPRPWGCFYSKCLSSFILHVFPTPVGVFLKRVSSGAKPWRLPHARGGVSA